MSQGLLHYYAYLLLPPGDAGRVIEAPSWSLPDKVPPDADLVLWGRPPFRRPPSPGTMLRHVVRRERAVRKLARRSRVVVRLAPPPGRNRATGMRTWLLGGALIELARKENVSSRLEVVLKSSDARPVEGTFAPGSDSAGTMRVELGGRAGVLRAAPAGGHGDPAIGADVLDNLRAGGVEGVPDVLARGEAGDVSYVVEGVVRGRRPRRLTDELICEVAAFLASFPRGEKPPSSTREDIEEIAIALPSASGDLLEILERLGPHIGSLPSIVSHRDLWAGNVFVENGRLSGIIDWDGAHLFGVPGVDLVQLFVSQYRERSRAGVGRVWLEKLWRTARFASITKDYWKALDVNPAQLTLDAIAIAWWAGWLSQALSRHERLLDDEQWLAANVSSVIKEAKSLL